MVSELHLLWFDPDLPLEFGRDLPYNFWTYLESGPVAQTRPVTLTAREGRTVLLDRVTGDPLPWAPGDGRLMADATDSRVHHPDALPLIRAAGTTWTALTGG